MEVRGQIDRSKHESNTELKLWRVEHGHLSARALMDLADLSLWRIKVQAFRMGLLTAEALGAGGCEDGSRQG